MAVVQLDFEEPSTSLDEYLRYCQIIADAFTKALDQNECNVKIVIGIAQELSIQRDEVEDLWEMMKPDVYIPTNGKEDIYKDEETYTALYNTGDIPASTIAAIKQKMKDSCYDCEFGWPKIDFNENFTFSFDKLKASLKIYTDLFKDITNPNLCHAAGGLNMACLQDLMKIITMLLMVYSSILALRKLSGISLSAFIKGVISGLLGQLLGSLNLQVDLSQTGLACILKVFEEIASQIPDGESLNALLPPDFLDDLGMDLDLLAEVEAAEAAMYVTESSIEEEKPSEEIVVQSQVTYKDENGVEKTRIVRRTVEAEPEVVAVNAQASPVIEKKEEEPYTPPSLASSLYQQTLQNLNDPNGQNFLKQFSNKLREDVEGFQDVISGSFKWVNDVFRQATDDFNEQLSQMFGLLDYFQCEFARSGTDFLEIAEYLKRLVNVMNLLSAIVAMIAKKQVEKLCKTKDSVAPFSTIVAEDIDLGGSHDLDPTDIIEEFLGKVVEETRDENDNIVPIIYDKDKEPMLPKLNLLSCNLHEFIEAHKIDNIIEKAIETVRRETEAENPITGENYNRRSNTADFPHVALPKDNVIDKDKWKVYPIQFQVPSHSRPDWLMKDKEAKEADLENNDNASYGLQSILDFVYNNPLDRTSDKSKTEKAVTNDTSSEGSRDSLYEDEIMSFRKKIETPFYAPTGKDKKSFENECRSIDDVLSILGNLQGK